jgi:hypothetical protein
MRYRKDRCICPWGAGYFVDAATCGAVLAMFVGALGEQTMGSILFGLFGLAVISALCAIAAFTVEMLLAGTGIREEVAYHRRSAAGESAAAAKSTAPRRMRCRQTPAPKCAGARIQSVFCFSTCCCPLVSSSSRAFAVVALVAAFRDRAAFFRSSFRVAIRINTRCEGMPLSLHAHV